MTRLSWLWPAIIILSTVAVSLVTFVVPDIPLRPLIVMWFLFVCPGMVVVQFLRLNEPVAEWTLALALSLSIDAIVADILLYAGRWSPTVILIILIGFSFSGAFLQFISLFSKAGIHVFSKKGKSTAAVPQQESVPVDWLYRR